MKHRPFAVPSPRPAPAPYHPVVTADPAYPPIEEFLDELPPIEDFLAPEHEEVAAPEPASEDEWIEAGWNSFDLGSFSELARRTPATSRRAISEPERAASQENISAFSAPGPSAEEVAAALDGIATRIRSGELVIDSLNTTPPEAAMAAAIAALLRMRG
jgi:hypothetical protein